MATQQKQFSRYHSPFKRLYIKFSASEPAELETIFMANDQELMRTGRWDYHNSKLAVNKIKTMLEAVGVENISDEQERECVRNMLWMWYHHAISCALWRYGDKPAAKRYSARALRLQSATHPNKITRLLYLLARDRLDDAEQWAHSITEQPERSTARHLMQKYKSGKFFLPELF